MRILITGTAGFIGFHLARYLITMGHSVVGIDGMTPYYDVTLKQQRHSILREMGGFESHEFMLENGELLGSLVKTMQPEVVIHLAAQAGVRYSIDHPHEYISSNLVGTYNILEAARHTPPLHLLIASSSSVYGANSNVPFRETDRTDYPVSLYAATKKACETISHSYAHLYDLPTTCFRFFTVYGPWGRPDMALFKFVSAIRRGDPVHIYGAGQMRRDFTYIDDLIESVHRLISHAPKKGSPTRSEGVQDSLSPIAPWRVVNIAAGRPVELLNFVDVIEEILDQRANRVMLPMQQGDVVETFADPSLLKALTSFTPNTPLVDGVRAFVKWHASWTA